MIGYAVTILALVLGFLYLRRKKPTADPVASSSGTPSAGAQATVPADRKKPAAAAAAPVAAAAAAAAVPARAAPAGGALNRMRNVRDTASDEESDTGSDSDPEAQSGDEGEAEDDGTDRVIVFFMRLYRSRSIDIVAHLCCLSCEQRGYPRMCVRLLSLVHG